MGQFDQNNILEMDDPYTQLKGDGLAENASVLNQLSDKDKRNVASKMVYECPDNELHNLVRQKEALIVYPTPPENLSFYSVLTQALQIRQTVQGLLDPKNDAPWKLLTTEFNAGLYHPFIELFKDLTKGKEVNIATRLAMITPKNQQMPLGQNILNLGSEKLTTAIGAAFELHQLIYSKLLTNNPESFFISKSFSKDICIQFSEMMRLMTEGKETTIATSLALQSLEKTKYFIARNVLIIGHTSPLTQAIATAFELHDEINTKLLSDQPKSFFKSHSFSVEICHQFQDLMNEKIKGHEEEIGKKLATTKDLQSIAIKLEQLNPDPTHKNNPIQKIQSAFLQQIEADIHQRTQARAQWGVFATMPPKNRGDEEEASTNRCLSSCTLL